MSNHLNVKNWDYAFFPISVLPILSPFVAKYHVFQIALLVVELFASTCSKVEWFWVLFVSSFWSKSDIFWAQTCTTKLSALVEGSTIPLCRTPIRNTDGLHDQKDWFWSHLCTTYNINYSFNDVWWCLSVAKFCEMLVDNSCCKSWQQMSMLPFFTILPTVWLWVQFLANLQQFNTFVELFVVAIIVVIGIINFFAIFLYH